MDWNGSSSLRGVHFYSHPGMSHQGGKGNEHLVAKCTSNETLDKSGLLLSEFIHRFGKNLATVRCQQYWELVSHAHWSFKLEIS